MWTEETRPRPSAGRGPWKGQSLCSSVSSLALQGSRGSGGSPRPTLQGLGPPSWVLRGAGLQARWCVLELNSPSGGLQHHFPAFLEIFSGPDSILNPFLPQTAGEVSASWNRTLPDVAGDGLPRSHSRLLLELELGAGLPICHSPTCPGPFPLLARPSGGTRRAQGNPKAGSPGDRGSSRGSYPSTARPDPLWSFSTQHC